MVNKFFLLGWFDVFHPCNEFPGWNKISMVFYRKSLHRRRMEILGDPITKNTKSPQRKFRFQNQDSGIRFISSGNVLRVGTNLSERFFLLLKCRKYPKKLIFFCQNLDFAWYFMVFLVRTSYTAADTLTAVWLFVLGLFSSATHYQTRC